VLLMYDIPYRTRAQRPPTVPPNGSDPAARLARILVLLGRGALQAERKRQDTHRATLGADASAAMPEPMDAGPGCCDDVSVSNKGAAGEAP
jgi:hypothetical protein